MKVSKAWLQEWVSSSLTGQQLAAQLTMAGLEVDAVSPVAGEFNSVVVAHVLRTTPHPQADKLTICEVDAGSSSPIQVVCGASNVCAGLKVALAMIGANLPGGMIIKETMLRGQLSQGMLCSVTELGLDDSSDGIMELPDDAPIGMDIRTYLALNDEVLDLDLTPNRADCFSILGVAREVAALNNLPLKARPEMIVQPSCTDALTIQLQAPEACAHYCGRVIRGINPQAITPLWIKERLRRSGVRVVHPVVDITNYVMLELGQPMHAFDLQSLNPGIEVRYSKTGEKLVLLDGQTLTFNDPVLVIADQQKPLAIAGIMGGEQSAVQADTVDVFLESAYFNPVLVAGVARRFNLCSDSSQRFERGVDPNVQICALEYATSLLQTIAGGTVGPITAVSNPEHLPIRPQIMFNPDKVLRLSGLDVPKTDMARILIGLGMTVEQTDAMWTVNVPSHRFDITLDVDLVEEIIRLHGYDKFVATPVMTSMQAGNINLIERLTMQISVFLNDRGYNETISYSFVDPHFQRVIYPDTQTMQLLNPISSELSEMRVGMWPGLLASMIYNIHRQQTAIKFFESGVVFDVDGDLLQERACIAGLMTGEHGSLNWSESAQLFDFYDMKGDLQGLFASLQLNDARFVAASHPTLHPGKSARILIGDKEAGWIGVLHPKLQDELDLTEETMLFELSLSTLVNDKPICYQKISKYPQIRRDLSLLVDVSVQASQIEHAVRQVVDSSWLKAFDVFDVYVGESIPTGKKSVAIALTLQDDRRTLVDSEINAVISAILKKLEDEFTIILRDQ